MVYYQCFDILNKHHKEMECKDLSVQDQIEQVVSLEIRKYNKFNSIIIIFDRLFNSLLSIDTRKI